MPEWLIRQEVDSVEPHPVPVPTAPGNREALIALEKQTFEIAFETALEYLADGVSFSTFCESIYHTKLSPVRFRSWIFLDEKRRKAYEVAKVLGTEAIEDEMIRISDGIKADGSASADDVPRSTIRINTRKWILTVRNREKYGEVKRVEQKIESTTTNISTLSAEQLNEKVIEALGFDVEVEGDT